MDFSTVALLAWMFGDFGPNNLRLESSKFGSVPLVLHSSGHLLLSLVNPWNTLDQCTVISVVRILPRML